VEIGVLIEERPGIIKASLRASTAACAWIPSPPSSTRRARDAAG